MFLDLVDLEVWKYSPTERRYLPQDGVVFTNRTSPISWSEQRVPEELNLSKDEEDLGVGIFSISATIKAATLYPGCLNVIVEDPVVWVEIEPEITKVIAKQIGADALSIFDSPQNID